MSADGASTAPPERSFSLEHVNLKRRRFLIASTTVVGAVGVAYALVPFISSMNPSAKAKAAGAPVEADISKLEPGQQMIVEWRGKPVWIVRRTQESLDALEGLSDKLRDPGSENSTQPEYAKNTARAIKPEYLVMVGICTHLGCSPSYRPVDEPHDLGADWPGGFFCPCHGSSFDLSGRVYAGVPAPTNMEVPPHAYTSDTTIMIGVDEGETA